MLRKIITIDEKKCNGCGACANACHEGAIGMVNGKARLLRDDYCDGLGDCLPACPTGAITFEEREAAPYDHEAVQAHMAARKQMETAPGPALEIRMAEQPFNPAPVSSQLRQWPVQIKLAPVRAPYFDGARLLIAADCTAYAYGNFHQDFISGRITLVGCPKLDSVDYSEKLAEILRQNDIQSISVVRMEVPCCRGMELAVKKALEASGKMIPWQVTVITTDGQIREQF